MSMEVAKTKSIVISCTFLFCGVLFALLLSAKFEVGFHFSSTKYNVL